MSYSHRTNHSFEPTLDFWKPVEKMFNAFPYWEMSNNYRSKQFLISFYEMETQESFDINDEDIDIYENKITELYAVRAGNDILLEDLPEEQRASATRAARSRGGDGCGYGPRNPQPAGWH